jgi:hypothetical protein
MHNDDILNAATVYENQTLVLGRDAKTLFIFIPNEAHESLNQPKSQFPLANQPYLPQNQ